MMACSADSSLYYSRMLEIEVCGVMLTSMSSRERLIVFGLVMTYRYFLGGVIGRANDDQYYICWLILEIEMIAR